MAPRSLVRSLLAYLAASTLFTGLPAVAAPHLFYDEFPFMAQWVHLLPPYNQHLISDVGALYLGFAVLFAYAAWTLQPTLIRAVCSAWLVPATLHLAFHAAHLRGFSPLDAVGEVVSLTLMLLPAIVALLAYTRGSAKRANLTTDCSRCHVEAPMDATAPNYR